MFLKYLRVCAKNPVQYYNTYFMTTDPEPKKRDCSSDISSDIIILLIDKVRVQ